MRNLFPYQQEGVEFLQSRRKALLYDDPGLGKTTQAIMAWPKGAPTVVVCPLSVKRVWEREIAALAPGRTITTLSGRGSFRWPSAYETVIINWDVLPKIVEAAPAGCVLVADEVHYAKSPTAQRSRFFHGMAAAVLKAGGQVHGLTGTPLVSWPQDLWGVTRALHLEVDTWGSWRNFFQLFRGYQTPYGIRWGQPRDEVPGLFKRNALGRKKETVLPQLPTRVFSRYDIACKAVKEERDITDADLMADFDRAATSAHISKARAALALAKASSKEFLELLQTWLQEGPFVVFSAHRDAARHVARVLGTESLDGECPDPTRQRLVDEFMAGKTPAIVGTIGAMGVGLTLTRASRVVFVDRAWTPAENLQAEDRAVRIGQTKNVQIVDLVSATSRLDDSVFRLLKAKQKIIGLSTEAARG